MENFFFRHTALLSAIADLNKKIACLQQLYNSKEFHGSFFVTGKDCNTGAFFSHITEINHSIPEFKEFCNSYGARLCAEKIMKTVELEKLEVTMNQS